MQDFRSLGSYFKTTLTSYKPLIKVFMLYARSKVGQ